MILGVQILGAAFGVLMTYFCFLHYKRREFSRPQFLFWQIIWLAFIVVVLFPGLTQGVIHKLGIVRTMDLLTILGIMFVSLLTFFNYVSLNKLRKKIEDKIREESLKELEK